MILSQLPESLFEPSDGVQLNYILNSLLGGKPKTLLK
jgi:hypothetical protein